jgi:hypothetical protein
MSKKNIYVLETGIPQTIIGLVVLVFCVIVGIINGENINIFIIAFFIFAIGAVWYVLKKMLGFCKKRDKALEQPVFATGTIIAVKDIYRYKSAPRAILYIKLDNGDIITTPEMWRKYTKKIVSPNVNIYKYEDFSYVGDIQLKSERGEMPISIPKI